MVREFEKQNTIPIKMPYDLAVAEVTRVAMKSVTANETPKPLIIAVYGQKNSGKTHFTQDLRDGLSNGGCTVQGLNDYDQIGKGVTLIPGLQVLIINATYLPMGNNPTIGGMMDFGFIQSLGRPVDLRVEIFPTTQINPSYGPGEPPPHIIVTNPQAVVKRT